MSHKKIKDAKDLRSYIGSLYENGDKTIHLGKSFLYNVDNNEILYVTEKVTEYKEKKKFLFWELKEEVVKHRSNDILRVATYLRGRYKTPDYESIYIHNPEKLKELVDYINEKIEKEEKEAKEKYMMVFPEAKIEEETV